MTILLTGATGFQGSHLLEAFLAEGYTVIILKRSTSDLCKIAHLLGQFRSYDVDVEPLENAFTEQHIDCVVHTACYYGRKDYFVTKFVETNVLFGTRLLDAAVRYGAEVFVNTDTFSLREISAYSFSKKQFVEWLWRQSSKIKVVNMKLEHMYGTKDDITKFIPWVLSQLEQNAHEIKLTKGDQERDFIHVRDVVSAYLVVLNKLSELGEFNEFDVGTGKPVSVHYFISKLKELFDEIKGTSLNTRLNFGAIPYPEGEMMSVVVNNESLKELGWFPRVSLEDGLCDIIDE